MSLDKTKARKDRVRQKNRELRNAGVLTLGEPGPWFSIPKAFQFDPAFFKDFGTANPPADTKFIGDTSSI